MLRLRNWDLVFSLGLGLGLLGSLGSLGSSRSRFFRFFFGIVRVSKQGVPENSGQTRPLGRFCFF